MYISLRNVRVLALLLGGACLAAGRAEAQNSSLLANQHGGSVTMADAAWTYQKMEEPKQWKLHDLITVSVSEKSVVKSDGEINRMKKGYGDLILPDWLQFTHGQLGAQSWSNGVPHIRGEIDQKLQTQGQLQSSDSVAFKITCEVVDIRPNGCLILEGHDTVKNNEEVWDYALSGEIRAEDIKPNNTILSENVAMLRIDKQEKGHVRDSYRRGWLLEWMDKWQPF